MLTQANSFVHVESQRSHATKLGSAPAKAPAPPPIPQPWELETMKSYNPEQAPDRDEWLALGEAERIELVSVYHRRMPEKLPNLRLHAAFHAVVENQLAEGIEVVWETLERLMAEGLDRHSGIHLIGSALAEHLSNLMRKGGKGPDPNEEYFRRLRSLTASSWAGDCA